MPYERIEPDLFRQVSLWGKTINTNLKFIEQWTKKLKNGYSPIIGICGSQRIGKSHFGLWISCLLYSLKNQQLSFKDNIFYEPEKAIIDLENKTHDILFIDEAADSLYKREWYNQVHIALASMINTQAFKCNTYILSTPFISDIDGAIRKHFDFKVYVNARGTFKVFKYVKQYQSEDGKNASYCRFLDYGKLKIGAVPADLWEKYQEYSIAEKEKIRKRRLESSFKTKDNLSDLLEYKKRAAAW